MILSFLSGLVSALALPFSFGDIKFPDLEILAWFSFVPFYISIHHASLKSAFYRGVVFGVGYFTLALYWIYIALHTYGEVSIWSSLLGVGLAVFLLGFFVGVAAFSAVWIQKQGVPLALSFPVVWVGLDFLRSYFPFGGFPWASVAYSQRSFLTFLQILDITGIYGILFLLTLSNAVLGELILFFQKKRFFPNKLVFLFLSLMVSVFVYGHFRLNSLRKNLVSQQKLQVLMIQGNIPQEEKWLEEKTDEIVARYIFLTQKGESEKYSDLILWPEAAYPGVLSPNLTQVDLLKNFKAPLLMGVVTYEGEIPEEWPPSDEAIRDFRMYNAAALVEPGGTISGWYHKNHLVPMGEYVPFQKALFFLHKIVPSFTSFTPGRNLNLIHKFGVTICYEDLFPSISRSFTKKGADFLVNLTNDGWYDRSSAIYQHYDFSRFRAIENRRAMVRVTNTGVTGTFGPTGEVIDQLPPFQEGILQGEIPVGGPLSFYTRFGDIFAWGCILVMGLLIGLFNKCNKVCLSWRAKRGHLPGSIGRSPRQPSASS